MDSKKENGNMIFDPYLIETGGNHPSFLMRYRIGPVSPILLGHPPHVKG
jgi:hypothetical protein